MRKLTFSQYFQEGNFPLRVTVMPSSGCQNISLLHDHEFSELAYLAHGSIIHRTTKGNCCLPEGTFFFMHPGMLHEYISPSPDCLLYNVIYNGRIPLPLLITSQLNLINQVYPGESLDFTGAIPTLHRVCEEKRPEIEHLLQTILKETEEQPAGHTLRILSLFMELIILLSRETGEETGPQPFWTLDQAVNFLHCHYSEKISFEELARKIGMSTKTMLRKFKAALGVGPAEYLINIRLQEARILLQTTNWPLNTVALECGFSNACHLWKTMKRKMNLTPRQIRES